MAIGGFLGGLANLGQVAQGAQQYNTKDAYLQAALMQLAQEQRRQQALAAIGGALGSGGQDISNLFGQPIPQGAMAQQQMPSQMPPSPTMGLGGRGMPPGASPGAAGGLTPPVAGGGPAGLPTPSQAAAAASGLAAGGGQTATAMQPGSLDDLTTRVLSNMMRQTNPVQIAQALKSARPNIDDATLATATQMLMQMTQSTMKADQVYALGLLREIGRERGQNITARGQDIRSADTERGQDIRAGTAAAGQETTRRGQDIRSADTRRGQDIHADIAARTLAQREQEFTEREQRLANRGGANLLTPQERATMQRLKQQMQALNNRAAAAGGWAAADEKLQDQAMAVQDQIDRILRSVEARQGGPAVRPPAPPSASGVGLPPGAAGAPIPPPQ